MLPSAGLCATARRAPGRAMPTVSLRVKGSGLRGLLSHEREGSVEPRTNAWQDAHGESGASVVIDLSLALTIQEGSVEPRRVTPRAGGQSKE